MTDNNVLQKLLMRSKPKVLESLAPTVGILGQYQFLVSVGHWECLLGRLCPDMVRKKSDTMG